MKTTNWNRTPLFTRVCAVAALCACFPAFAIDGTGFKARYTVLMNGKPRLESYLEMSRQDEYWTLESTGHGTKGLARMLGISNAETSRLEKTDAGFRPLEFQHHSKIAGRDERWSAVFDHGAGQVQLNHEEGSDQFSTAPGTWDPLSLTIELRQRLAAGEVDFELRVANEDEINTHHYRAGDISQIETSLGCLNVIKLERVRENSKRYSRSWYAPEFDFIPVRIQHGKQGGKDFDMRIEQLTLDGRSVSPRQSCMN